MRRHCPPDSASVRSSIVALSLVVAFAGCGKTPPPDPPPVQLPEPTITRSEEQTEYRVARTDLRESGTLGRALASLEIPNEERARLIDAVAEHLDLRRLPARTGIVVWTVPDVGVARLSIRHERERFLRIEPGEGGTSSVRTVELPVEPAIRRVEGVVTSSVAEALAEVPFASRLTLDYADIFQWDVDLMVDPRPGDRVRLVFELLHLGALPEDLPSFGNETERPGDLIGYGRILAGAYEGAVASAEAFWLDDGKQGAYFDREGRPLRKSFLKSPLNYRRISSRFSRARRNPVTRRVVPHHGVDYAARAGTPVVASADGRVVSTGWAGALGRTIKLRHGSEYVTLYGHLRRVADGIRPGVEVRQNQVIGYVGSTGRATGPHLHYTVLLRGSPIDPLKMDNPPIEPLDPNRKPELDRIVRRYGPLLEDGGAPTAIAGIGFELADDGT